jgi:hypothetical protein
VVSRPVHDGGVGTAVPAAPPRRRDRRDLLVVVATAALGLAHALVVTRHYAVGSFDDDASYVMTARALAHGTPLTGTLPIGYPVVATYPPGFALLLAPLALVAGAATWPYQALVCVCFVALFPLTHLWLRRAGAPRWLAAGVLVLLALNPVAATFATMVMAEAPFLVVLLGAFLAAQRWAAQDRGRTAAGVATVLLAAGLLWLKQAGLGLVVGLALWLLLQRHWRRALALLAGVALVFTPVLALRAVAGTSLAGARYSTEIGGFGGLGVVPGGLLEYARSALATSVLPLIDVPRYVFVPLAATVPALVVLGVLAALRRRSSGPATVATLVYLAETLLYPYINERRLILVLPVVLAWYLAGAGVLVRAVGAVAGRHRLAVRRGLAAAGAVLLAVPLLLQFDRHYILERGQDSGRPLGSDHLGFVAAVTAPGDVVETPYLWTTSLGTGRAVANGVFFLPDPVDCTAEHLAAAALADGAGYAVDAAWNGPPPVVDCQVPVLDAAPWAVRLYRDAGADASVWEFVGPGTVHPDLADAVGGPGEVGTAGDAATLTWSWPQPRTLTQLTVAAVTAGSGATTSAALEWRDPAGGWHRVAAAAGPVGPGTATPWLVWRPAAPVAATAVRVAATGGPGIRAEEVHALVDTTRVQGEG